MLFKIEQSRYEIRTMDLTSTNEKEYQSEKNPFDANKKLSIS